MFSCTQDITRREINLKKRLAPTIAVFFMLFVSLMAVLVALPDTTRAEDFNKPGYALIASPQFGDVSHGREALKLRNYLVDKGWTDDRIILLGKWTGKNYVDGAATKENIEDGINQIALQASEDDIVFIAILDHAHEGDDGHVYFRTGDAGDPVYMKDTEFGNQLDQITDFRYMVVYVASPFSGNFVEGLEAENRLVLSDCDIGETYDVTLRNSFYKALTRNSADFNDDDEISIEEAHKWMEKKLYRFDLDPIMSDFDETEDCFLY